MLNKNGIPFHAPRKKRKRIPLNYELPMCKFALIDDEAEVEVVVPCFSPVIELLKGDGWREIV